MERGQHEVGTTRPRFGDRRGLPYQLGCRDQGKNIRGFAGGHICKAVQTQSCSDCFLFGKENKSEHWAVLVATSMTSPYAQLLSVSILSFGIISGLYL